MQTEMVLCYRVGPHIVISIITYVFTEYRHIHLINEINRIVISYILIIQVSDSSSCDGFLVVPLLHKQNTGETSVFNKENCTYFQGHRDLLSNMFPCCLPFIGKMFNCAEQLYQHIRCGLHGKQNLAKEIFSLTNPYRMKEISHIETSNRWRDVKVDFMFKIIKLIAIYVPEYVDCLTTAKPIIVECCKYNRFWTE